MISLKSVLAMAAVAVACGLSSSAQAATLTASQIVEMNNPSLNEYVGTSATSGSSTTARANAFNILGASDGNFYSLGQLGYIILSFGNPTTQFAGASIVVEIGAGGSGPTDREQAEVYVGNTVSALKSSALGDTSNSLSVGHISSDGTSSFNIAGGPWTYLLIKDTSLGGNTTYGVDIDSVRVTAAFSTASATNPQAVPLPTSAWSGMGLMGLLAAKRIRKGTRSINE